jgi:CrcB protein
MLKILLVGLGGSLGAISRYLVSELVARRWSGLAFPVATMSVNILGCLLIGFLAVLAQGSERISDETRVFLIVGLLGGFTTFSSFGHETFSLLEDGHAALAAINVVVQVVVGLLAVWLGVVLARVFL